MHLYVYLQPIEKGPALLSSLSLLLPPISFRITFHHQSPVANVDLNLSAPAPALAPDLDPLGLQQTREVELGAGHLPLSNLESRGDQTFLHIGLRVQVSTGGLGGSRE